MPIKGSTQRRGRFSSRAEAGDIVFDRCVRGHLRGTDVGVRSLDEHVQLGQVGQVQITNTAACAFEFRIAHDLELTDP